jgi:hypothetical protein
MTEQDAKKALAKLFLCFSQNGDEVERNGRLRAYWEVLEELGAAKIIEVCSKAMRGQFGAFMPSAGELYQAAIPKPEARSHKPPPKRLPNQNRFLSSAGTLWIDGVPYSSEEQTAWSKGQWPPGGTMLQ